MKQKTTEGFTLAELLIVVAIIAVLTAIAIPVFAAQIERSAEGVDIANVRSAYAEVMVAAMGEDAAYRDADGNYSLKISPLHQKNEGFNKFSLNELEIGGVKATDTAHWQGVPVRNGSCTVKLNPVENQAYIIWSGDSGTPPAGEEQTPQQIAAATNLATFNNLVSVIQPMFENLSQSENSAKVKITVKVNSDATIEVKHPNGKINENGIRSALENAGYLKNGKVVFDQNDENYPNGYYFEINNSNGAIIRHANKAH